MHKNNAIIYKYIFILIYNFINIYKYHQPFQKTFIAKSIIFCIFFSFALYFFVNTL